MSPTFRSLRVHNYRLYATGQLLAQLSSLDLELERKRREDNYGTKDERQRKPADLRVRHVD